MVKVLYFVDRMLKGGIQSLVIEIVRNINKEKVQIDFLLLDDGKEYELENTLKDLGCKIYKLNGIWVNTPIDFFKYIKALDKFFKEHNDYDVVHLHSSSKNYMVLKKAKKYKIPVRIAHSHNIDFQTKNLVKKFIGNIRNDDPDGACLAAPQGTGGIIGLVIEAFGHFKDTFGGLLIYPIGLLPVLVAHDKRHEGYRNSRFRAQRRRRS